MDTKFNRTLRASRRALLRRVAKIGPGPSGAPSGPPAGYKALTGTIPQGVGAMARQLLSGDFGTMTPFKVDGLKYMARVEPHYHPPGFKGGPNGWHKGVTVYVAIDQTAEPVTEPSATASVTKSPLISKIDKLLSLLGIS